MFAVAALHFMKSTVPLRRFSSARNSANLLSRATALSTPLRTTDLPSLMRSYVPVDIEIVVVVGAWNRERNTHIHIHVRQRAFILG